MIFFLFLQQFSYTDTFHPYLEDRERFERHINPTFSSDAGKNKTDLLSRVRVGAEYAFSPTLSAKVEYQNADDWFWDQAANSSADSSDASLAYLKYSTPSLTLTAGRQKVLLGEQRLIGPTEWLNLARSFDAGRAQFGPWDIWGGRIGVANTEPETARMGAVSHADKSWGTTSLILKHDLGAASGIDIQTLDHFVTMTFGRNTLAVEGAVQYGSNNGRDQRAWAWHAALTRDLLPKTTFTVEGNAASGGGDGNTSRTFDNLYPSNHDLYGLADLTGWKNMNELIVRLENHPCKDLTLKLAAEGFSLRDTSDGWYGATGTINSREGGTMIDPTGASGGDLGKEYDFEASYTCKTGGTLSAGIAIFEPGNFVQRLSGFSNQLTYGFVQYQIRFK